MALLTPVPQPVSSRPVPTAGEVGLAERDKLWRTLQAFPGLLSSAWRAGSEYFSTATPSGLLGDVRTLGGNVVQAAREDPAGFALDMTPVVGEARSMDEATSLSEQARAARARGDIAGAEKLEAASAMALVGAMPLLGTIGRFGRKAGGTVADVTARTAAGELKDVPQTLADEMARRTACRSTGPAARPGRWR